MFDLLLLFRVLPKTETKITDVSVRTLYVLKTYNIYNHAIPYGYCVNQSTANGSTVFIQ